MEDFRPSEDILKAVDEVVDVDLEETRKRSRKRSSILKQPKKFDDEQAEDLQNTRKSFSSKRRVSFAEKFQVMELCTGNVYDIPGKSTSTSDSLTGNLTSISKSEIADKDDTSIHITRNEIQVSLSAEIKTDMEEYSSLSFTKKHKIDPEEEIEPERKRINVAKTDFFPLDPAPENIFKHEESFISEFKNYLFGTDYKKNDEETEKKVTELTFNQNAGMSASVLKCKEEQKNGLMEKQPNPINSKSLRLPETAQSSHPRFSSENLHLNPRNNPSSKLMSKSNELQDIILSSHNSLNVENNILRDSTNVEMLPISISDVPLEENKENIYVDLENKNILVTNPRDLKLNLKNALQLSPKTKFLMPEKQISTLLQKGSLDTKCYNPVSEENQVILHKQKKDKIVDTFMNKTCKLNHSMELTCIPSEMDLTNKLEQSIEDDNFEKDQLNKTQLGKSDFMDLTCNVQDLSDSLYSVNNDIEMKKQHLTNLSVGISEKYSEQDDWRQSTEDDNVGKDKILSRKYTTDQLNKTQLDRSYFMDLTCNEQDSSDSFCSVKNDFEIKRQQPTTLPVGFGEKCSEQDDWKNKSIMEITCNTHNVSDILSVSTEIDHVKKQNATIQSVAFNKGNDKRERSAESVESYSKMKHFSSVGMELTCDVESKINSISNGTNACADSSVCTSVLVSKRPNLSFHTEKFNASKNSKRLIPENLLENSQATRTLPDCDPMLWESKKVNLDLSENSEKTRFVQDEMELTCSEKDILIEKPSNFERVNSIKSFSKTKCFSSLGMDLTCNSASNIIYNSAKRQISSQDEVYMDNFNQKEINPAKHQKLDFMYNFEKSASNIICENQTSIECDRNLQSVSHTPEHLSGDHPLFIFNNKTQQTSNNCLVSDNRENVTPVKSFSKTKHFSSLAMELTCNVASHVRRQCLFENELSSEKNYSLNGASNFEEVNSNAPSETCLNNDEKHRTASSVKNFSKTKCFSSYGMELTCNLGNDSYLELLPNSSLDSVFSPKKFKSLGEVSSSSNKADSNECAEVATCKNYQIENRPRKEGNCAINIDSVTADAKDQLHNKSNSSIKQGIDSTGTLNENLIQQNFVKKPDLFASLKNVSNTLVNKSQNFPKSHENADSTEVFMHEPGNRVTMPPRTSASDIVYAIKQLKGMNQVSANDNIFKFPEVFLSLKKQLWPKISFSCPKIQLNQAIQDVIRRSSSFSCQNDLGLISEFSKKYTLPSSGNEKIVPSGEIKSIGKEQFSTPKSSTLNISHIPHIIKSASSSKTVRKSLFIKYCQSPRQNASINKSNITDKNNSFLNKSPDTIGNLRGSECEISYNQPSLIISHVHESIFKDTTVAIEDTFPDATDFNLNNCSLSLVRNDDTLDDVNFAVNSKNFNEFNLTSCLNEQPLKNIPEISLNSLSLLKCQNDISKNILQSNSLLSKQTYQSNEVELDKSNEINNDQNNSFAHISLSLAHYEIEKDNQSCLLERPNQSLLKQRSVTEIIKEGKSISDEEIRNLDKSECNLNPLQILKYKTCIQACGGSCVEKQNLPEMNKCINIATSKNSSFHQPEVNECKNVVTHKNDSFHKQTVNESIQEVQKLSSDQNERDCNEMTVAKQDSDFYENNMKTTKKGTIVCREMNKKSLLNKTYENDKASTIIPKSPELLKDKAENICQDSIVEKQSQFTCRQNFPSDVINTEGIVLISEQCGNNISEILAVNPSTHLKSRDSEVPGTSFKEVENPEPYSATVNEKDDIKPAPDKKLRNNVAVLLQNSSIHLKNQNERPVLCKNDENSSNANTPDEDTALIKESKKKNIDDISIKNSKCLQEDVTSGKNPDNTISVENFATLEDNPEKHNKSVEDNYERIHTLRRKFMTDSENELWELIEMDDKQAVFEILVNSVFANYIMHVDLDFNSKTALCTKITFKHRKEDPDDIDELGFLLFQTFVSNNKEIFPFSADKILDKLPKLISFALSAKSLIKDIWLIAIRNEISIDNSQHMSRLTVQILNMNSFSLFSLTFPINLKSYPNDKIIPEIEHLEYNHIENEIILNALKEVPPGIKYLHNMVKVASAL